MPPVNTDFTQDIEQFENVICVCFGQPRGDELPQVANGEALIIDLLHDSTGKPLRLVDAEIHHQMDPSYQKDD